jgi:hypothetical protein
MYFATQNFACINKKCHYHHVSKVADIPVPSRQVFTDWVAATKSLEWAPGRAPAGTV